MTFDGTLTVLVPRFKPSDENKHGVEHHIVTEGPPLHARARRLDADKLAAAKAEFTKMEELGIIRRSNSPWLSLSLYLSLSLSLSLYLSLYLSLSISLSLSRCFAGWMTGIVSVTSHKHF